MLKAKIKLRNSIYVLAIMILTFVSIYLYTYNLNLKNDIVKQSNDTEANSKQNSELKFVPRNSNQNIISNNYFTTTDGGFALRDINNQKLTEEQYTILKLAGIRFKERRLKQDYVNITNNIDDATIDRYLLAYYSKDNIDGDINKALLIIPSSKDWASTIDYRLVDFKNHTIFSFEGSSLQIPVEKGIFNLNYNDYENKMIPNQINSYIYGESTTTLIANSKLENGLTYDSIDLGDMCGPSPSFATTSDSLTIDIYDSEKFDGNKQPLNCGARYYQKVGTKTFKLK